MAYTVQSFNAGAVLQAAQVNQIETNIREHRHGRDGVFSIFDNTAVSVDATLALADAGRALFVNATKTVTIAPTSIGSGWYAAVFNVASLASDLVTVTAGSGSLIDRLTSITIPPQQGCLIIAQGTGGAVNFSTIGRDIYIPQNAKNTDYTLALADAGGHLYHNIASAHLYTVPANASVPFPIGTPITMVNASSAGNIYVAITTDTLRKVGTTDTGTRTIAANGMATLLKVSSSTWFINGTGLT
jgi:hypothetical protein